ncbi:MAG TPA: glycosyltransferase [Caldithrix abyssi]|uniref:Glycosyltransferase n=1 Tax=Caldithrix abyssi TaxID=187145 RepID=A0A7V4U0L0_CALAY|nr:glycosyltransferase [Caldithrix abyssi]
MKRYQYFSVIIPSYNRADELSELFDSVRQLNFPKDSFEVIVADDGSTDETPKFIEETQAKNEFTLRYFTQQKKGPGAARNLGMENAKGDFFIFIDSDVILPPDWLKNIEEAVNREQADAFGGPDTYLKSFPPLLKAINYTMTSFITTGGLRGKKGKMLAKYYPRSFNMGLSRELWQKIGGFHPRYYGEDIEFSHRIINAGARVIFIESAFLYHKRRTNLRKFFTQVYRMGSARIFLYKIDPAMLEPLHAIPALAALAAVLVAVLALFFEPFRYLFAGGLLLAALVVVFSMLDSIRMYKDIRPALYLPLVIPAQVFGYGFGFISNYIRRVWFNLEQK